MRDRRPNTYATELSLERRTVLLKLHGAVDPFPEREWESFVITEDDYIDYLGRSDVASSVPVALAARLRRSHFLFIGYEMVDWNLRLVMHRVWGGRPVAYRSWAVDPSPTPLESAFWRRFQIDVLDVDARRVRRAARAASRKHSVNIKSPYRGLAAFEDSELDALYFFGRERDTEIVVANLIASRFTVLYGPSGVGKSTLLLAGVARKGFRELPEEPVIIFFSRLERERGAGARHGAGRRSRESKAATCWTSSTRGRGERDVYVILDQAEEYFTYHGDAGRLRARARRAGEPATARQRAPLAARGRARAFSTLKGSIPNLFAQRATTRPGSIEPPDDWRSSARSSAGESSRDEHVDGRGRARRARLGRRGRRPDRARTGRARRGRAER